MTTAAGFVVTGGTGALGRAAVLGLLGTGARVAVPYRGATGWKELRAAAGDSAALWGAETDIADVAAAARFMDEAAAWLGGIDGLAALAGGWAGSGTVEASPASEWDQMLRLNLQTTYAACRGALPHLLRRRGSVVTVSSRSAETAGAGAAGYAVAKCGVVALTRILALENRERGVRFNCVSPGVIDTPANRRSMPDADFSRWTPPEAIVRVALFLLSPASSAVTGGVIPVDGR